MKTNIILSILILTTLLGAQETGTIARGSDYLCTQPGKVWYIDGWGSDGRPVAMNRRYSIPDHIAPNSAQVPVKIESFIQGMKFMETIEVYRIKGDGSVFHEKSQMGGIFKTFDPPQMQLPARLEVGTRWSITEPSGDVFHLRIEEAIEKLKLPNGLIINNAIKIAKEYRYSAEHGVTMFEYYGRGLGFIGSQLSDGKWAEVLRR